MAPPADAPGGWLTDCNFTTRGVESLADDLVVPHGHVHGRVVLLLRSIECQPWRPDFFRESFGPSPHYSGLLMGSSRGDDRADTGEASPPGNKDRDQKDQKNQGQRPEKDDKPSDKKSRSSLSRVARVTLVALYLAISPSSSSRVAKAGSEGGWRRRPLLKCEV